MKLFIPLCLFAALVAALPEPAMTEEQWLAHAASKNVTVLDGTNIPIKAAPKNLDVTPRHAFPLERRDDCKESFVCSGGCGCTGIPCTRFWACFPNNSVGCAGCLDLCYWK